MPRIQRSVRCRLTLLLVAWAVIFSTASPLVQADEPGSRANIHASPLAPVAPGDAGMDEDRLSVIREIVAEGLERERMPGCVVLVGRRDAVVFREAFGRRQTEPFDVPMTADTVFDLASLTKPIATATSVWILIERGQLQLDAPAADYLPEFATAGKENITIRQLLTHTSGLIPDNALRDYQDGSEKAWHRIFDLQLSYPPGEQFRYSDVGYLVLGRIVERVSGKPLGEFTRAEIWDRLDLRETGFTPGDVLKERAAPTEQRNGEWIRGEVHDPRAWALGGVAGHAGLFSTADDLSVYARALLGEGKWRGRQIMRPETVRRFLRRERVPRGFRTPGWDSRSPYSSNRGDLMSPKAVGHGGFTGTAIWLDPDTGVFVIFLSNRVHPNGQGSVNTLAGRIATVAAAAVTANDQEPLPPAGQPCD